AAARATYERTRALAAGAGNERLLAVVEQNLGILEDIGGDTEAALARYRRALAVVEHAGDPRAAAMILSNIGLALAALGDPAAAEASFDRAAGIAAGLDDERTLAAVELNRAELLLERGALAEARRAVDRAHAIATRMGSRWRLAQAHRCYGILHREAGEPAAAEEHLARAVELARAAGDRLVEAEAESERGILHFRGGDNRRALRSLNRAHRLYTELGARRELADLDRRLDGLEETYLRVVQRWGEEIESIDGYTAGHCQRVAAYACALAAAVGFGGRDLAWIRMGAFLHDVGKTAVPGAILNKPGPLTPEEWVVMRAHAEAGARIVAELDFPWEVGPMVRNHHERWDGGGYPDGLAGEEIPLTARILCVADCYDALTTPRSYRPALAHAEALAVLADGAGCGFDPRLVAEFHRVVG
ncbi:MAG TPA: HD domain-containing phosphohydrolase, partial [Longimicrobiaceae bacterium]|nr:HD domain-containing phosphohydrolase [Longimicrobiaceae bacterium]